VRTKMFENETTEEYDKRMKKYNYHNNPSYAAHKKLQYYKRLYKGDELFKNLIEKENDIIDILLEVVNFHHKKKLNLI